MTTFDCLPFDVIDYILNCDCISYIDICRLATVSKICNCVAKSNKLWKKKYLNKWPELAALYDAQDTDFRLEFQVRINYKKLISKKLSELSAEYFYHQEIATNEAFRCFKEIGKTHPLGHRFIINEFENIIFHSDSHLNLTHKYYAQHGLIYMRHAHLETLWKNLLSQPVMSLLEGICLISQWCRPNEPNCTSQVATQIEAIANLVMQKVQQCFPHHPIVKHGLLKDDVLSTSLWSNAQCKDIFKCMNEVMFEDYRFFLNQSDIYSLDSMFIENVLTKKKGISLVLGVIYSTVARKLGIACLYVDFPGRFLLKWLEHPGMDDKDGYTFIDVIDKGIFKQYNELRRLDPGNNTFRHSWTEAVPTIKVFIKLVRRLVDIGIQVDNEDLIISSSGLKLLCLLDPDNLEHKFSLARLFLYHGHNVSEAVSILQEIAAQDPTSQLATDFYYQSTLETLTTRKNNQPSVKQEPKLRDNSSNVKFAVGMIMKHIKYNYRCVIYGWDQTCTASDDWKVRMGVHTLLYKDKQPFYNVLVDDDTNRYAAQENLQIDRENKPTAHLKIGKYFESFHGNYYLPNEQTLLQYPQDNESREKALQQAQAELQH